MRTAATFPTRSLECLAVAKELRRERGRQMNEALANGSVVIQGLLLEELLPFFAGMGDFVAPNYGVHFRRLMRERDELIKCFEAAESRGFSRDICSSMRCHIGQLVRGMASRTQAGAPLSAHFVFQVDVCQSRVKTGQIYSEYLGIPYFVVEQPCEYNEHSKAFFVAQLQEAIGWMEKVTGRRYDDEALVEGVKNDWACSVMCANVIKLNKAIPAPLDQVQMEQLRRPWGLLRHKRKAVEYFRQALQEVEERVKEGVSARGMERARLLHEGITPFYYHKMLRLPEEYGAVFVGGHGFEIAGAWNIEEDGTWRPALTPEERGIPIRTREDALESLAELYLKCRPHLCYMRRKEKDIVKRAIDWSCDGVVFHLDMGCNGLQAGYMEVIQALRDHGIPVGTYQSSQADPRDFSEFQAVDQLEAFFESLGLAHLEGVVAEDEHY